MLIGIPKISLQMLSHSVHFGALDRLKIRTTAQGTELEVLAVGL